MPNMQATETMNNSTETQRRNDLILRLNHIAQHHRGELHETCVQAAIELARAQDQIRNLRADMQAMRSTIQEAIRD